MNFRFTAPSPSQTFVHMWGRSETQTVKWEAHSVQIKYNSYHFRSKILNRGRGEVKCTQMGLMFLYRFSDVKLPSHGFLNAKIGTHTYRFLQFFSQKFVHFRINFWTQKLVYVPMDFYSFFSKICTTCTDYKYLWTFACVSTHATIICNFKA